MFVRRADIDQDSTYSGDGSNPDSGKGPSEEGDNCLVLHQQQNQGMALRRLYNVRWTAVVKTDINR